MASAIAKANGYDPSAYYHEYRKYTVFASVKEMNETERLRLFAEGDKVTKGAKEFYSWLIRYSCRIPGVSWQLVEKMAERYGKSDRTIKRYISELKKAGWVEVIRLTEGNLKGQNIYRIVKAYPVKAVEASKEEETNDNGSLNFDPTDVPSRMSSRDGAEEANSGKGLGGGNPEGNHSFKSSFKSLNHLSKDRKDDAKFDPSGEQSEKSKQGEAPQDGGYYDEIPSLVRIRLVAKNRSAKFVNGCFKRITWAFRNTELSRFTSIDKLAFEISNKIQYVYNMEKKGRITGTFFGYFYKAMLDLFKKIEARYLDAEYEELMSELAESAECEYDFRKSPLYQARANEYAQEDSVDMSDAPSLDELVAMYGHDRELLTYRVSQWYNVTFGQADIMIADYLGEDLSGLGLPI